MVTKKVPMRMCTACREMKPKKELIRVVKTEDGVKLDLTGKLNGRGAYICKNIECFAHARKSNALSRAFEMNIPQEVYEQLEKELSNVE